MLSHTALVPVARPARAVTVEIEERRAMADYYIRLVFGPLPLSYTSRQPQTRARVLRDGPTHGRLI